MAPRANAGWALRAQRRDSRAPRSQPRAVPAVRPAVRYRDEVLAGLGAAPAAALDVLLTAFRQERPEVYGHGVRVAGLAVPVGRALGLSGRPLADLARGALLHDVGKMLVAESLLNKTGRLSAAEVEALRRHPQLGCQLLAAIPGLGGAGAIVSSSHEWVNGRGYPGGLAGHEIPIGARITALVDAFDAMTTPRPYRAPVSVGQACAELVRCVGTQFDQEVVAVWLRLLDASAFEFVPRALEPAGSLPVVLEASA